jgi:uncharacterized protein with HEPN domain
LPSKKPAFRLQDIIENADDIASWIDGMNEASFRKDRKTIRSVERSIEMVIEAATKLDDDVKARLGAHPWHLLKGMGNKLRHEYDKVSLEIIWDTAANKIPLLAADCRRVLDEMRPAE